MSQVRASARATGWVRAGEQISYHRTRAEHGETRHHSLSFIISFQVCDNRHRRPHHARARTHARTYAGLWLGWNGVEFEPRVSSNRIMSPSTHSTEARGLA